jgi:DNA-binding NarL/FixJ family response regulator
VSGGPVRVLIVDDQPIFASTLTHLLQDDRRLEVVGIAKDGPQAVDAALFEHADVVLMDLSLPTWGGVETMRRLLAIQPTTRVIVLTGLSSEEAKREALEAGAAAFLTKGNVQREVADMVVAVAAH